MVTTDEGSSPKRLVIQALGYIIYLMDFMYSRIVVAARTNKHCKSDNKEMFAFKI